MNDMTAAGGAAAAPKVAAAAPAAVPAVPSTSTPIGDPSSCLVLKNMFNPASEEADNGPEWAAEIKDDVASECAKFGKVLHCVVDANNPSGFVYLMFGSAAAGKLCGEAMHGRFFGGMCVAVQYFPTKTYVARFPSARALQ
jgi:RNA-binding protein 39